MQEYASHRLACIGTLVEIASLAFSSSCEGVAVLVDTICGTGTLVLTAHSDHLARICHSAAGLGGMSIIYISL